MVTMNFKKGVPTKEELWTIANHFSNIWKRVGRVLQIEDFVLDQIEADLPLQSYKQSLAMLREWTQTNGSKATYKQLGNALMHPSINRPDLMKKTCCIQQSKGTSPPCSQTSVNHIAEEVQQISIQEADENKSPRQIPQVSILPREPFHKTFHRGKELRELQEMFSNLDKQMHKDVSMVYITGPPGSGKTQLSRLYSEWFGQQCSTRTSYTRVIATLHAETPQTLLESYINLMSALNLSLEDINKDEDVKKKLTFCSEIIRKLFQKSELHNFEWLIIIDNAFVKEPLKEFWPMPGNGWGYGHVIVTTQDSELAPSAHSKFKTLPLTEGMSEEDAIRFLCLLAGLPRDDACADIARKVNYYPLPLACAAVFVKDMKAQRTAANFSWKNCLENLEKYFEHLKYCEFTDHNHSYPHNMLQSVIWCANRMSTDSQVFDIAFKFLSFLTIQPIPLDLLKDVVLKIVTDEVLVPDVLKKKFAGCSLLNYGSVRVRGLEVFSIHQVMIVAFEHLRKESSKETARTEGVCLKIVEDRALLKTMDLLCSYYNQFKGLQDEAISNKILLSPHLESIIKQATTACLTKTISFIDASVCLADSLIHHPGGTDHQRVQILETAQEIQKMLNLEDLGACRMLIALGYTYREAGRLDDVIPVLETANKIAAKHDLHHPSHLEWLKERSRLLNVLGWTYRETYQLDLACSYMEDAVQIAKEAYGECSAVVVEGLSNLGIILADLWRNDEAQAVMEEASQLAECLDVENQSVQAQVANYMGKIYLRCFLGLYYESKRKYSKKALELLDKSKKLHEKAMDIYERLHGKQHKFYLGTAMTYATVLSHVGQHELGLKLCKEALRIYQSSGHIAWPRVACILADIYLDQQMYDVAKRYLEGAIQGNKDFHVDECNPRAWLPHARLAEALIHTRERRQGMELLTKCIDIWEQNGLNHEHYWMVRARINLEN